MGNVGDDSVSSYRLHASETLLPYVVMAVADATPICSYLRGAGRGQPSTNDGLTCNTPYHLALQWLRYG